MTAAINSETGKDYLVIDFTGEVAQGLQGNILNPEGVDLLITNSYAYSVTPATAAATMNVGPGVSGADNSECHGALPINATAGTAWMGYHPAVTQDGALVVLWGANEYMTFTTAAASAAACEMKFYFKYLRLA